MVQNTLQNVRGLSDAKRQLNAMAAEHPHVTSRKIRLFAKLRDKTYRDGFVASRARRFLAHQMRSLRGETSQVDFGKQLGKPQSVVSRLEDPAYGKWTVQTLLEIGASLDRAVLIQFVDWGTCLTITEDADELASAPASFSDFQLQDSKNGQVVQPQYLQLPGPVT